MKEIIPYVFFNEKIKNVLFTKNLIPEKDVYGERLKIENNVEYREFLPIKSKLAAGIIKGIKNIGLKNKDVVLYLGASTGTTASHISDIVGKEGFVFAVENSASVIRDLVFLCEERKNITPIFEDANHPEIYEKRITKVDWLYQDVSQKNQVDIFLKNVEMFLKKESYCLLAVKAKSIDVTKKPAEIFEQVKKELEKKLKIIDFKELQPFQKDHCLFVCQK